MNRREALADPLLVFPDDRIPVLSLWNPWLDTFFASYVEKPKRIENRKRPLPENKIGKWIAFQSAQKFDYEHLSIIGRNAPEISHDPKDHKSGFLHGLVFVTGCVSSVDELPEEQKRWWLGPFAYLTPRVIAFDELIPCQGQQGWKFLSQSMSDAIRERYGSRMAAEACF